MSYRKRHRVGCLTAAGLAAGAALAWGAPAAAAPRSGEQIVFNGGGILGVTCAAQPDRSSVTVPAESTLRVVNRTGFAAALLLDGTTRGELGDGQSTEVVFRRGPVSLSLLPGCVLGGDAATVRVQVAAATRRPVSSPAPAPSPPSPAPRPAANQEGPATDAADRGRASGTGERGIPAVGGLGSRPAGADTGSSVDRPRPAGVADRAPVADRGRPAGPPVRSAGSPAAGSPAPGSPVAAGGGPGGVGDQLEPAGSPAEAPQSDGATTEDAVAAEPVGAMDPVHRDRPFGLLALVAAICVIGVSFGAIRAIVAQRASRTNIA